MDYMTWCIIAGIAFWVLFALAVVTGVVWVFCYIQYYRWDKQDRERNTFINAVQAAVQDAVKNMREADEETYGDVENDPDAEANMMQDY